MVLRRHHHEPVGAERIGLQPADIDGAGDDADVADALGDQADDLIGQPLLQVDIDLRVGGQEQAERLGQEFGQRVGVGEQADLARQTASEGGQVLAHPGRLIEQASGVL